MIGSATNTGFRLYFSENFLYPELETKYKPIIDSQSPTFRRLIEYINMSVCSNRFIPGITIPEANVQYSRSGIKTIHTTGLNTTELLTTNTLSVEMKLKSNCINYLIMMELVLLYLDRSRRESKDVFLPPIILDIIGDQGNIIAKFTYKSIYCMGISDLNFDNSAINLNGDTFRVEFGFNDYTMDFYGADVSPILTPEMTY